MAFKQSKHIFQGMSRDLSEDKQKGIYYIDAHNIRITAREDETLLSVTNEKGNKMLPIKGLGKYVGHAVLNNYLVLFTVTEDNTSVIWRIDLTSSSTPITTKLYEGNLGFSTAHPIETLVDYETEDIQKVYWTDGDNQPRMINIVSNSIRPDVDTQFDFIPEVFPNGHDDLNIKVAKLINSSGTFKSGTIQYFVSYYNKFGQESNIVWQSPLLYISPEDRGGNVSETVGNAFQLKITGAATTFDFIRIYSVQHTSEDTDLIGRRIIDLSIPSTPSETITFIDNGILGESLNPSELYYKGGVPTTIGTMTAKDQTLFLGNIKLRNTQKIDQIIKDYAKDIQLSFKTEHAFLGEDCTGKYYDYYNQLNENGQYISEFNPTLQRPLHITHSIKSFKYLETYRFGLQFQDIYGRWSEPVFIGDIKNTVAPTFDGFTNLPIAETTLDSSIVASLYSQGYIKVRPLVVLPNENERECIAQGVLCPTVYNVQDRLDNSPFAQPSWFFRPYGNEEKYTVQGVVNNQGKIKDGSALPFTHNARILGQTSLQGEIEKAPSTQEPPLATHLGSQVHSDDFYVDQSIVTLNSPDLEFDTSYPVDLSDCALRIIGAIKLTGFSGALDLTTSTPQNNTYKATTSLAFSDGYSPEGLPIQQDLAFGLAKKDIKIANISNEDGWKIMGSGPYWIDTPYRIWKSSYPNSLEMGITPAQIEYGFIVYPWQSAGSLNNAQEVYSRIANSDALPTWPNVTTSSTLSSKTLANIRYSSETCYFAAESYDTSDIQIVDPLLQDSVVLKGYDYQNTAHNDFSIVYYTNIDKLLPLPEKMPPIYQTSVEQEYNRTAAYDMYVSNTYSPYENGVAAKNAIFNEGGGAITYQTLKKALYDRTYFPSTAPSTDKQSIKYYSILIGSKTTATHITYKSIKHAVIALQSTKLHIDSDTGIIVTGEGTNINSINPALTVLPSVNGVGKIDTPDNSTSLFKLHKYGAHRIAANMAEGIHKIMSSDNDASGINSVVGLPEGTQYIYQKNIEVRETVGTGTLLIGEIYRTNLDDINRFGGTTDDAIQQNVWIPAGESTNLGEVIRWTEGDTYFQRYDCLKTYPYSNESTNNIVEILSFMCETRVNIAGRYDKNRGLLDNTFITNENFNLINKGYTQRNNFFSYRTLDRKFDLEQFKTQLTWTKVKSTGATIDNWTNVTLQNTLDLDGDKGELVSLNRYNNEVIAFQPKGISQIIYNPNVQINTTSGLPIEIANSGRVQGKRYLYEGIGCQNKWSICDEVYGSLYFIDNYAKSIFRISSDGLVSLTDNKGLREWMQDNNTLNTWRPYQDSNLDKKAFRTFYDKGFKDVYFVNDNTCLAYSALLDQFISFMDYQSTDAMFNIGDNFYAAYTTELSGIELYQQFAGDYNSIYGKDRDYYITFIDNQISEMNKIYTNLEYRSDTYVDDKLIHDETFDTIRVYNEYQDTGEHSIKANLDKPYLSDLQKKFRVWRIQIPRDKDNPLNRINNTWAKFTLRKYKIGKEKTILHDVMVGYYI